SAESMPSATTTASTWSSRTTTRRKPVTTSAAPAAPSRRGRCCSASTSSKTRIHPPITHEPMPDEKPGEPSPEEISAHIEHIWDTIDRFKKENSADAWTDVQAWAVQQACGEHGLPISDFTAALRDNDFKRYPAVSTTYLAAIQTRLFWLGYPTRFGPGYPPPS